MLNDSVIDIAKNLINRRSVTPDDAGCQDAMKAFLGELGFDNETMIKALAWGYSEYEVEAKPNYCTTPRANGLAYPSVAYNMGRMYNRYLVSQGADVYQGGDREMDKKYNIGDKKYHTSFEPRSKSYSPPC